MFGVVTSLTSESDEEVSDDQSSQCEPNGLLHAAKDAAPVSSNHYIDYTDGDCIILIKIYRTHWILNILKFSL